MGLEVDRREGESCSFPSVYIQPSEVQLGWGVLNVHIITCELTHGTPSLGGGGGGTGTL